MSLIGKQSGKIALGNKTGIGPADTDTAVNPCFSLISILEHQTGSANGFENFFVGGLVTDDPDVVGNDTIDVSGLIHFGTDIFAAHTTADSHRTDRSGEKEHKLFHSIQYMQLVRQLQLLLHLLLFLP